MSFETSDPYQQETNKTLERDIAEIGKLYKALPKKQDLRSGKIGFYFEGTTLYCVVKIKDTLYRAPFSPV